MWHVGTMRCTADARSLLYCRFRAEWLDTPPLARGPFRTNAGGPVRACDRLRRIRRASLDAVFHGSRADAHDPQRPALNR